MSISWDGIYWQHKWSHHCGLTYYRTFTVLSTIIYCQPWQRLKLFLHNMEVQQTYRRQARRQVKFEPDVQKSQREIRPRITINKIFFPNVKTIIHNENLGTKGTDFEAVCFEISLHDTWYPAHDGVQQTY